MKIMAGVTIDINDYGTIDNTGTSLQKEQIAPEDEVFHSIYVAGKMRKHDDGTKEMPGLLQVRGHEYNKEVVYMIITHVKAILVKEETRNEQTKTVCSSFLNTDPWVGSSGQKCGANRAERDNVPYCVACRQHLIVAGIMCDENGAPQLKDNQPVFGFIRGKGFKYSCVGDYINMLSKIDPASIGALTDNSIFTNVEFEKKNINHKRFVTGISPDSVKSDYGDVNTFEFTKLVQIPDEQVLKVLNISKKMMKEFEEKFNWAKKLKGNRSQNTTPSQNMAPSDIEKIPDPKPVETETKTPKADFSNFDFGDVSFEE
jgi:hypothetical protein